MTQIFVTKVYCAAAGHGAPVSIPVTQATTYRQETSCRACGRPSRPVCDAEAAKQPPPKPEEKL